MCVFLLLDCLLAGWFVGLGRVAVALLVAGQDCGFSLLLRWLDLRFGLAVTCAAMFIHRFSNQFHSLYNQFLYPTKLPIAPRTGQLLVNETNATLYFTYTLGHS